MNLLGLKNAIIMHYSRIGFCSLLMINNYHPLWIIPIASSVYSAVYLKKFIERAVTFGHNEENWVLLKKELEKFLEPRPITRMMVNN